MHKSEFGKKTDLKFTSGIDLKVFEVFDQEEILFQKDKV